MTQILKLTFHDSLKKCHNMTGWRHHCLPRGEVQTGAQPARGDRAFRRMDT